MAKSKPSKGTQRNIHPDVRLPDSVLDARVRVQASENVLPKTLTAYQKKIWTMQQWLKERNLPQGPISDENLSRFLASHKGGVMNGNTARFWRTAARKWRMLENVVETNAAATALLDAQIGGITYKAGNATQVAADVIDSGRLGQMTNLLTEWKQNEYALHFIFIFYSVFRKVRGGNVLVGDIRFDTDVGTLIASKRAKFANSLKVTPGAIGNFKEVNNLTKFLKTLTKGKRADERLFPNYCEKTANDLIKRCATHLKWGEGKWCVLSLRHGSSREAQSVLEDEPSADEKILKRRDEKLSKRFGHSNIKSKKRYQKSTGSEAKRRCINAHRALSGMY